MPQGAAFKNSTSYKLLYCTTRNYNVIYAVINGLDYRQAAEALCLSRARVRDLVLASASKIQECIGVEELQKIFPVQRYERLYEVKSGVPTTLKTARLRLDDFRAEKQKYLALVRQVFTDYAYDFKESEILDAEVAA